jgi:Antibiotic biosynthesis monooxygenase
VEVDSWEQLPTSSGWVTEQGNRLWVHRSTDNPNEFWLYETWADEAAVEAHEIGAAFKQYKEVLRPLVEPDSVLFGNTVPIKVLGYGPLPEAAGGDPTRSA